MTTNLTNCVVLVYQANGRGEDWSRKYEEIGIVPEQMTDSEIKEKVFLEFKRATGVDLNETAYTVQRTENRLDIVPAFELG